MNWSAQLSLCFRMKFITMHYFVLNFLITVFLHCTLIANAQVRNTSKTQSSVIASEIKRFEELSKYYWDTNGPLGPLHAMNSIRVPFILSTLKEGVTSSQEVMDIGCGGGLLTEELGFKVPPNTKVIGIDPECESIKVAEKHLPSQLRGKVTYLCASMEDYLERNPTHKFDTVVISEVIEHVDDPESFIGTAVQLIKPNGSLILTTPAKTYLSYLSFIFVPEQILRTLPVGLHHYEKLVDIETAQRMINQSGCKVKEVRGGFYLPFKNTWRWSPFGTIHWYAIHAVKS